MAMLGSGAPCPTSPRPGLSSPPPPRPGLPRPLIPQTRPPWPPPSRPGLPGPHLPQARPPRPHLPQARPPQAPSPQTQPPQAPSPQTRPPQPPPPPGPASPAPTCALMPTSAGPGSCPGCGKARCPPRTQMSHQPLEDSTVVALLPPPPGQGPAGQEECVHPRHPTMDTALPWSWGTSSVPVSNP